MRVAQVKLHMIHRSQADHLAPPWLQLSMDQLWKLGDWFWKAGFHLRALLPPKETRQLRIIRGMVFKIFETIASEESALNRQLYFFHLLVLMFLVQSWCLIFGTSETMLTFSNSHVIAVQNFTLWEPTLQVYPASGLKNCSLSRCDRVRDRATNPPWPGDSDPWLSWCMKLGQTWIVIAGRMDVFVGKSIEPLKS